MKIVLDQTKMLVEVEVARYSKEQRGFLDLYIPQLAEYGFVIPNTQAIWPYASLLVPEDAKAKYCIPIDLGPVNASSKCEQFPMPISQPNHTIITTALTLPLLIFALDICNALCILLFMKRAVLSASTVPLSLIEYYTD